jgi:hypothetical protein
MKTLLVRVADPTVSAATEPVLGLLALDHPVPNPHHEEPLQNR